MKVTIDFPSEIIEPAVQLHLDEGVKVQEYVIAAVKYFTAARAIEADGVQLMGHGDVAYFKRYNTVMSPKDFQDW